MPNRLMLIVDEIAEHDEAVLRTFCVWGDRRGGGATLAARGGAEVVPRKGAYSFQKTYRFLPIKQLRRRTSAGSARRHGSSTLEGIYMAPNPS